MVIWLALQHERPEGVVLRFSLEMSLCKEKIRTCLLELLPQFIDGNGARREDEASRLVLVLDQRGIMERIYRTQAESNPYRARAICRQP